jgi:O-antigen ligase
VRIRDWRTWALAAAGLLFACLPSLALAASPLLIGVAAATRRPYRLGVADFAASALVLWTALSIIWSISPGASTRAALYLAVAVASFVGVRSSVRSGGGKSDLLSVAAGYLAGCFVLVLRMAEMMLTHPAARPNLPGDNANYAAYTLTAGLAVLFLFWRYVRIPNWATVTSAGTTVFGIFASGSRGAILSVIALATWLALTRAMKRAPILILSLAAALAALVTSTSLVHFLAQGPLEAYLGRGADSWSGRLDVWPLARQQWESHFLFGTGAHSFATVDPKGIAAHNAILELGSGTGLVGVLLFLAAVILALRGPGRRLVAGAWIATSTLSYLTGSWEIAAPGWFTMGIVSAAIYCPNASLDRWDAGPERLSTQLEK